MTVVCRLQPQVSCSGLGAQTGSVKVMSCPISSWGGGGALAYSTAALLSFKCDVCMYVCMSGKLTVAMVLRCENKRFLFLLHENFNNARWVVWYLMLSFTF